MKPEFITERLILRPFTANDQHLILDLDSDPEVMRYINGGIPSTPAEVAAMTARIMTIQKEFPQLGFWNCFLRTTNEFVGWYLLRPQVFYNNDTEVGYRLKRKFWNQGFATEGSHRLLRYGFDELKISKVLAIIDPKNQRSENVLKKLGLKFIDVRPYENLFGKRYTVRYFEATAAEYRQAADVKIF